MFETSLLPQRRGKEARVIRAIAFGSVALQVVAVTAFIVVPLIHPDTLPSLVRPPKLTHVEFKRPELKVVPLKPQVTPVVNTAAVAMPARMVQAVLETRHGGMMSRVASLSDPEPALALGDGNVMGPAFNAGSGIGSSTGVGSSPVVVPRPASAPVPVGPVRVSSGVSRGLLIDPIRPAYPPIAKAAHQQGTVVVKAVIDRSGRIVNAQVTQGPEMLRDAAITAVRDARYHPYLLNGQPTEVVTTITITFEMGV